MKRKINKKSILIVTIVVGFFYTIIAQFPIYKVADQSMSPNFKEGDVVLMNNNVDKETIKHNDICVIQLKEDLLMSRVVGCPGDKIEIRDGVLLLNDQEQLTINTCFYYKIKLGHHPSLADYDGMELLKPINSFEEYEAILTNEQVTKISRFDFVKSIQKIILPNVYSYTFSNDPIYPHHPALGWSRDNFGPITIPEKGDEVGLNKRVIKNNYYFLLGDNRFQSLDSRYWGLIAEKDIKGKLISKLYSMNK
jgi:signal peptidase I